MPAKKSKNRPLRLLGSSAKPPTSPDPKVIELFPNPAPGRDYLIRFQTEDFTSLCPVTGQADFATISIDYIPGDSCIESKSLKFYLASYRNEKSFNEAVVNRILSDLAKACKPVWMHVEGEFAPRGGISLSVVAEYPDTDEDMRL